MMTRPAWSDGPSERIRPVDTVDTACADALDARVAIQRAATTVHISTDAAGNSTSDVIRGGHVWCVEQAVAAVASEVHTGILGDKDAIRAVVVDRVG